MLSIRAFGRRVVDPYRMLNYATFHLGLHALTMHTFKNQYLCGCHLDLHTIPMDIHVFRSHYLCCISPASSLCTNFINDIEVYVGGYKTYTLATI